MKKRISIFTACVLLFVAFSVTTSAATFSDTVGKNCETAVEVLASLGIVEGKSEGAYEPDSSLTRAEMATIILRTMNMAETAEGKDIFPDVPSSHWAYANIATAYSLRIVNGTSETTFEPDETVTYEQAVKMVVAALGYSVQAEAAGGYPAGYLAKAAQLDLLKGVEKGGEMKRGNMAILLYNALDTELFLQYTFGDEAYDFETNKEKTLLSYYLKVNHTVATVEATYAASAVAPAPKLLSDEVKIGGVTMKAGETNAQNMLGMRADVYTRADAITEKPMILAIVPRQTVEAVDLAAKDIEGLEGLVLSYEDAGGTVQKADLTNATVIYNGRVAAKDRDHLIPVMGTVRLISDNNECKYTIVESYTNHVVDTTSGKDKAVYFKDGTEAMTIDTSDNSLVTLFTDVEGMPVTITDIAEWDILSVAKSEDEKVLRIHRSNNVAEGKITEKSEDEVVIADTAYPVAPSVFGTLSVGMTAGYYLDFTGAIAAIDETYQAGGNYGWLVSAATTKGLAGKPQLKIFTQKGEMKVFDVTENIKFNEGDMKSSELLKPGAEFAAQWVANARPSLIDSTGAVVSQLLKYEVNDTGLITSIETAANTSDPNRSDADKIDDTIFSMDWFYSDEQTSAAGPAVEFNGTQNGNAETKLDYKIEGIDNIYFTKVWVDEDTTFFIIPFDKTKEEAYSIRSLEDNSYTDVRETDFVSFYDVNDEYYCKAMVMHSYLAGDGAAAQTTIYPNESVTPALITKISITLSEDGEVQNTFSLYDSKGKFVNVTVPADFRALYKQVNADINADPNWYEVDANDEKKLRGTNPLKTRPANMFIDASDLMVGDVIQYTANSEGTLTMASVVFREKYADDMEITITSKGALTDTKALLNYRGSKILINGTVKKVSKKGPIIEVYPTNSGGIKQTDSPFIRTLPDTGKFVLWDKEKRSAAPLESLSDIQPGDKIFSYTKTVNQLLVVVYRD